MAYRSHIVIIEEYPGKKKKKDLQSPGWQMYPYDLIVIHN